MNRVLTIFLISVAIPAANLKAEPRQHEVNYPLKNVTKAESIKQGDSFDWQNKGPLAFIEFLKQHDITSTRARFYTVFGSHKDWIDVSDIASLIELLDSNHPCAAVNSVLSSLMPQHSSTLGREAAFLIEGFRAGNYPPTLDSVEYFKFDPVSIRQWWIEFKSNE